MRSLSKDELTAIARLLAVPKEQRLSLLMDRRSPFVIDPPLPLLHTVLYQE